MNWTSDDWARLGAHIRSRRERLGLSRAALSARSNVSQKAIQLAEGGAVPKARWPQSLGVIESALGWAPGSSKAILDGGDPTTRVQAERDGEGHVTIPVSTFAALVRVAAHVSAGRSAAFISRYPDALARKALGELDDAGLLEQFRLDEEKLA